MSTVTFLPLIVAESLDIPSHVISIRDDYSEMGWRVEHKSLLTLKFDDIEGFVGPEYRNFDYLDALKILSFVRDTNGDNIVVHCHAGISRSAAVAKFLSEKMGYELVYHALGSNTVERYNREVYRTLEIAHYDRVIKPNSSIHIPSAQGIIHEQ